MLNLGGIFGSIGRMLPGYMQGERQAIADNWRDLQNYNAVQAGQIQNAFQELTFPLAYNMYGDRAALSRLQTLGGSMDLAGRLLGLPGEFQASRIAGAYRPLLTEAGAQKTLNAPDYSTLIANMLPGLFGGGFTQQPQMTTEQQLRQQQQQAQNTAPNMPTTTVTP